MKVKKLSKKKKELLKEFVDFRCEICGIEENKNNVLTIHRIKRGKNGGLYSLNNIKIVCNKCHKLIHLNSFK